MAYADTLFHAFRAAARVMAGAGTLQLGYTKLADPERRWHTEVERTLLPTIAKDAGPFAARFVEPIVYSMPYVQMVAGGLLMPGLLVTETCTLLAFSSAFAAACQVRCYEHDGMDLTRMSVASIGDGAMEGAPSRPAAGVFLGAYCLLMVTGGGRLSVDAFLKSKGLLYSMSGASAGVGGAAAARLAGKHEVRAAVEAARGAQAYKRPPRWVASKRNKRR